MTNDCSFETDRLQVGQWHSLTNNINELVQFITTLMTELVTRWLPSFWQGVYTLDRAHAWINERDSEGTTLLIVDRSTGQSIGVMILLETESESDPDGVEIRIGYLLAEQVWGQGYASELIAGFVGWCRNRPTIRSLIGGVARENAPSSRVLEKNGFRPLQTEHGAGNDERLFRLNFTPVQRS